MFYSIFLVSGIGGLEWIVVRTKARKGLWGAIKTGSPKMASSSMVTCSIAQTARVIS